MMTTTTPTSTSTETATVASSLRRLYFVRFAFAIVWAVLVFITAPAAGSSLGFAVVALLVLYPLFDVAAAVVDSRANRGAVAAATPLLYINMALSLAAAIGLAIASASGASAVLVVWGAWAITAGAVQLIVALRRRALGGQWAMILSGGISVLAGAGIASMAASASASVGTVAGYATLGGIFFLISALRLGRAAKGL